MLTQNQAENEPEQGVQITLNSAHVKLGFSRQCRAALFASFAQHLWIQHEGGAFISVGMLMPIKTKTVGAMLLMAHPSASSSA